MIRAIPVVVAVLACLAPGCVVKIGEDSTVLDLNGVAIEGRATRNIEAPLGLKPGERLFVSTSFGKVAVEVYESLVPKAEARLSMQGETDEDAERALRGYRLVTRPVPGGVRLVVEGEPLTYEREGSRTTLSANVDLNLIVRPGTPLDIETGSGDVRVKGPAGDVTARSNFGDIEVEGASGTAKLTAGSGDVTVSGLTGEARLNSNFGSVKAKGVLRVVTVEAGSGDVRVTALPGSAVAAPWQLKSNFGDVDLAIPSDCRCSLEAQSNFGDIRVRLPATGTVKGETGSATYTGQLAGGGNRVALMAGSGDVTIEESK